MAAGPRTDVFGDVSAACEALARRSPALHAALDRIGAPHIRRRPAGFGGLARIIIEQQVSVPSAQAILARFAAAVGDPAEALAVRRLGVDGLRDLGISRPKARYIHDLADETAGGALDFSVLAGCSNDDGMAVLQRVRGVGPWSAAIYLLFCEGRVDIWPSRDVALRAAFFAAQDEALCPGGAAGAAPEAGPLPAGPSAAQAQLDDHAASFAPYRGVAAHILWTYYARLRGRTPI